MQHDDDDDDDCTLLYRIFAVLQQCAAQCCDHNFRGLNAWLRLAFRRTKSRQPAAMVSMGWPATTENDLIGSKNVPTPR